MLECWGRGDGGGVWRREGGQDVGRGGVDLESMNKSRKCLNTSVMPVTGTCHHLNESRNTQTHTGNYLTPVVNFPPSRTKWLALVTAMIKLQCHLKRYAQVTHAHARTHRHLQTTCQLRGLFLSLKSIWCLKGRTHTQWH